MSKPSNKRSCKERKRRERRKELTKFKEKRKMYMKTFPRFVFANDEMADPQFVELIKSSAKKIRFDDPELFTSTERTMWKLLRRDGHEGLDKIARENNLPAYNPLTMHAQMKLGSVIFNAATPEQLARWLPYNDVTFGVTNCIIAYFRNLLSESAPDGTIYY